MQKIETETKTKRRNKTIYSFVKNTQEEVRAGLTEYKGYKLIDIRVWYKREGQDCLPTKKGLTLSVKLYPELKKTVDKLGQALSEQKKTKGRITS